MWSEWDNVSLPDTAPVRGINTGDTAFMILATTFVFIQTPAMGIAQAGLLRKKNVLSMITQTMVGVAIGSLLYTAVGFSLFWGDSVGGIIGRPDSYPLLFRVSLTEPFDKGSAQTIPAMTWCAFQMMFALMTPVIVTGAWAEKFTMKGFITFVVVWPLLVYYPLAHWLWHPDGWMQKWGVQDFAGGMVIHTSSGVSGLVIAGMLKHRRYMETASKQHHNLPLFATGSFFIWAGWYFFNGGSAGGANLQAAVAMMNTHLAACSGSFVWMCLSYYEDRKFQLGYFVSGALSGLGGITAGSGFTSPQGAMCIGVCSSYSAYVAMKYVQRSPYFDDVLDCFALQGAPGMVGSSLIGIFGDATVAGKQGIAFGGDGSLLGKQLVAVAVTTVYSGVWTYLLMRAMRCCFKENLEVNDVDDAVGLDLCQIGEAGYDGSFYDDQDKMLLADKVCDAIGKGDFKSFMWLKQTIYDTMPDMWIGERNRAGRNAFHVVASCASGLFWHEDSIVRRQLEAQFAGFDPTSDACTKWLQENSEAAKVVMVLLDNKVCVNESDNFKRTPLQYAMDALQAKSVHHNRDDRIHARHLAAMANFLRCKGALTNPDAALSRLNTAAMEGDLHQLKILLSWPGVVDLVDYDQRSALHVACEEWMDEAAETGTVSEARKKAVKYLLYKKANRNMYDRWGDTAHNTVAKAIEVCKEELEKAVLPMSPIESRTKRAHLALLEELETVLEAEEEELVEPDFQDGNKSMMDTECPRCHQSVLARSSRGSLGRQRMSVSYRPEDDEEEMMINEATPMVVINSTNPAAGQTQVPRAVIDQALSYASSSMGLEPLKRLQLRAHQYASITDEHGLTLLHVACLHGRQDIVQWLVSQQPEGINATSLLEATDNYGYTPMYTAVTACHRQDGIVRALRDSYRSSHNEEEWPLDPKLGFCLCAAARENDQVFLNALRISGCTLADADYDGRTALHLAVCEQHPGLVEWLLSHDHKHSQLFARDRKGNTPYDDALAMKKYCFRRLKTRHPNAKEAFKTAKAIYGRLRAGRQMTLSSTPSLAQRGVTLEDPHNDEAVSVLSLHERLEDHPFRPSTSKVNASPTHEGPYSARASFCDTAAGHAAIAAMNQEELEALVQQLVKVEFLRHTAGQKE